jgi:hypothetical protein
MLPMIDSKRVEVKEAELLVSSRKELKGSTTQSREETEVTKDAPDDR